MIRVSLALALGLTLMGAGPAPELPVPPIPPAHPPADQAAPVPDIDAQGPLSADPQGVKVGLNDFRVRRYDSSMGYTQGSHFQTSEEKRPIQTPGLMFRVPIQ
jgi:hypothetical protein